MEMLKREQVEKRQRDEVERQRLAVIRQHPNIQYLPESARDAFVEE